MNDKTYTPVEGPYEINDAGLIYGQAPDDSDDEAPFVADVCDSPLQYTERERATGNLLAASWDMFAALEQARAALNAAPRFKVPSLDADSYEIAAVCDRAMAKALGK